MQLQPLPNDIYLLRDEYKSPLETIDAALSIFAQIPAKRLMVVTGIISELQGKIGEAYRELGLKVGAIASRVLFWGMAFKHFRTGAKRGGLGGDQIINCHKSVKTAIDYLRAELKPGDVVLLKGRGGQQLSRIVLGLMDREVNCDIPQCGYTPGLHCANCPMLETGWPESAKGY